MNSNCNFTFAASITPKVTSVSPNSLNEANTLITINGENFNKDASKVKVNVGSENCEILSASQTKLTCTLNRLALGNQPVVVSVDGKLYFLILYFFISIDF